MSSKTWVSCLPALPALVCVTLGLKITSVIVLSLNTTVTEMISEHGQMEDVKENVVTELCAKDPFARGECETRDPDPRPKLLGFRMSGQATRP
jgi:hypothetical protein